MYRTVLIPGNRDIHIKLPASLVGKEVEIIANATDRKKKTKRKAKTESWKEIEKFYNSIRVDMSNFKFNRDEIHER